MSNSTMTLAKTALYGGILVLGIVLPLVFPAYIGQMTMLWLMVVFALTWDVLGGQMGYNSLGNIFFHPYSCSYA